MRYSWQIIAIVLAIVVVLLSAKTITTKTGEVDVAVGESEMVLNSIMTRNSVRKYTNQRISEESVEKMLRAGMAAPTAGNRQPWEFYVVRDTSIIKQFPSVTKYANMTEDAQLAIVVCGVPSEAFPEEKNYWIQDVSAATENILLAAHAQGIGAVWCGVYPGEDRVATLRNLLQVPDKLVPFNIIVMGYPDGEQIVKDKWKPSKIHYVTK